MAENGASKIEARAVAARPTSPRVPAPVEDALVTSQGSGRLDFNAILAIADVLPVLMWVTRLDRTRDFVNDAYMDFLNTDDREHARTYDWRSGIHPDDVERIIQESLAGEASMQTFTLEGRFRRGDGEYRWLKSTSSPRFGADGEHIGFIGLA